MMAAIALWVSLAVSVAQVESIEVHAPVLAAPPPRPPLPEEMRAFLVDPPTTELALSAWAGPGFRERTKWKKLSASDARALGAILLAQEQYQVGGVKACIFETTLEYRMKRGSDFLTIRICHHCAEAHLDSPHQVAGLPLDRVNGDLIALARKYFPKDEVLLDLSHRPPGTRGQ